MDTNTICWVCALQIARTEIEQLKEDLNLREEMLKASEEEICKLKEEDEERSIEMDQLRAKVKEDAKQIVDQMHEIERLKQELDVAKAFHDVAVKERDYERAVKKEGQPFGPNLKTSGLVPQPKECETGPSYPSMAVLLANLAQWKERAEKAEARIKELEASNFELAAGACEHLIADDFGSPICELEQMHEIKKVEDRVKELEAEVEELRGALALTKDRDEKDFLEFCDKTLKEKWLRRMADVEDEAGGVSNRNRNSGEKNE